MSVSDEFLNLIRREISIALGRQGTRIGLVSGYDPIAHAAKVHLQPEGTLTGWLPVGAARSGNGAGIFFAPQIGDQVLVHFLEGDHDSGIIGMRLYSMVDEPLAVPAGQMWIVDDAGTSIKLTNDGNINLSVPGSATLTIEGNLAATISGDASFTVGGNLSGSSSGTATVAAPTVIIDSPSVRLGGAGGKRVALDGDPVVGGLVQASSTNVTAQ